MIDKTADPQLEFLDPTPNIWEMFRDFDKRFFNGILQSNIVTLSWSSQSDMIHSTGVCRVEPTTMACRIELSKPLLELRSRKDLVQTLIHEMIHALLNVTGDLDDSSLHGPKFHHHMNRINQEASLDIAVCHTFDKEVLYWQKYVPGQVMRPTDRKRGLADYWSRPDLGLKLVDLMRKQNPSKSEVSKEIDKLFKFVSDYPPDRYWFLSRRKRKCLNKESHGLKFLQCQMRTKCTRGWTN